MAVHEHGVGQWPQMFCRLQFGRIRRQKEQVDMIWHAHALGAVPASPIQDEHDLFARARSHYGGEGRGLSFKKRHAHGRSEVKDGVTGGGMDKAHQVAPRIPMLDRRERAFAVQTPDLAQDRFEPNSMFVHGPELDSRLWEGRRHLAQERAQTCPEVRLRLRVSVEMAWARHPQTSVEPPQVDPTQLTA